MTPAQQAAALDTAAERAAPPIRAGFLTSARAVRDGVDVAAALALIERRDTAGLAGLLDQALAAAPFRALEQGMGEAMLRCGKVAGGMVAQTVGKQGLFPTELDKRFSAFDPSTQRTVNAWITPLVAGFVAQARDLANGALIRALGLGRSAALTLQLWLGSVGLSPRQQTSVERYLAALTGDDKAALRQALRDKEPDPAALAAIVDRVPLSDAALRRRVAAMQKAQLVARSKALGENEARRAASIAQQRAFEQAAEDGTIDGGRTRKLWINMHDAKVRHTHNMIPALSPDGVPLDQPFPVGDGRVIRYPHDPEADIDLVANCRCWLTYRAAPTALSATGVSS